MSPSTRFTTTRQNGGCCCTIDAMGGHCSTSDAGDPSLASSEAADWPVRSGPRQRVYALRQQRFTSCQRVLLLGGRPSVTGRVPCLRPTSVPSDEEQPPMDGPSTPPCFLPYLQNTNGRLIYVSLRPITHPCNRPTLTLLSPPLTYSAFAAFTPSSLFLPLLSTILSTIPNSLASSAGI